MQLLIDIGNSRSKYLTVEDGVRGPIKVCLTTDIDHHWLTQYFFTVDQVIVANVGSEKVTEEIQSWCITHNIRFKLLATESERFGVTCAYVEPQRLGIDRWLVILAATEMFPEQTSVVVDAGTATTFDVIDHNSQHIGGWILPGINLMQSTLVSQTQRIEARQLEQVKIDLGQNTSECVSNGAWVATVATIEHIISRLQSDNHTVNLLLTGGNGAALSEFIEHRHQVIDDLVFIGMQRFIGEQR